MGSWCNANSVLRFNRKGLCGNNRVPTRSTNVESELLALSNYNNSSEVIKNYDAYKDNRAQKRQYRDEVVNGCLAAIDIQYYCYQQRLYEQGFGGSILTDWVVLGLGGATTLASGTATKAALGAAITGSQA